MGKVAGNVGKCGEEEIAEAVSLQAATGSKSVLEEAAEKGLILTESDHTVADVAGWENIEFAPQSTRTATIIGDRNDGRKIGLPLKGVGF